MWSLFIINTIEIRKSKKISTIKFENNDINVIIDENDIVWFNANEIANSLVSNMTSI